MPEQSRDIFRKQSLERLSTPDRLDQLLKVVRRRSWIPLLGIGLVLLLALLWSVLGRIPVTADAVAVLVHPRRIVPVTAPADGVLSSLELQVNEIVQAGQEVGRLDHAELVHQRDLEKRRKVDFEQRTLRLEGFNEETAEKERQAIAEQRERLAARIEEIRKAARDTRDKSHEFVKEQRERLEAAREVTDELARQLDLRVRSYEDLQRQGLASRDSFLAAVQRRIANQLSLAEIEVQLKELELREIRTRDEYERQLDLAAGLEMEKKTLEIRELEIERRLKEAAVLADTDLKDIQRNIDMIEEQLKVRGRVTVDHGGRILELTAPVGSFVKAGQRIAMLERSSDAHGGGGGPLVALAYFAIRDGKRVKEDMAATVSPATVRRERFGSVVGKVEEVSPFPVTADAVANEVGNQELARMLVGAQSRVQVRVALATSSTSASGFAWTSAEGPDTSLTAGTTATVRVTLEERAPITLLIPVLRGWLGLD